MSNGTTRPRRSTGKRLRFEVFKRDSFTCQYCGAQPPDVTLVVDHITPVALDGPSTIDNLITACEPCNQGKSDKPLTTRQIRPDADALYLEAQQEIAELRRFEAAKLERDELIDRCQALVTGTWCDFTGWHHTSATLDRAFRDLLSQYDPNIVDDAVRVTAVAVKSYRVPDKQDKYIAYMYAVARNMAADRDGE